MSVLSLISLCLTLFHIMGISTFSIYDVHNVSHIQMIGSNALLNQVNEETIKTNSIKKRISETILKKRKRSALLSSGSTQIEGSIDPMKVYRDLFKRYDTSDDEESQSARGECRKRRLKFCSGHVPFNSTVYPNIIGDNNEAEVNQSIPFFNLIAKSGCNKRLKQLLCTFLEPPCHNGRPIPPCKKFCRVALEGCAEYIPATLELSSVFDCRQYPDSTDPTVCVNLALGNACANDEFHCPDLTCISKRWVCDGVRDCIFASDEANCANGQSAVCSSEEFQCDRKCVPLTWKCDGDRDCQDGSDEVNCTSRPQCGPDRFKCSDGFGCIPRRWVCDGKEECRDGSDEVGCIQKDCSRGDFKCDNGICIPMIWRCDSAPDCKDMSDEKNCVNIASNGMRQMVANANTNSNTASSHTPFQLQLKADAHTQQQSQKPQQQQSVLVSHNNIVASHQSFDNNHRWTLK